MKKICCYTLGIGMLCLTGWGSLSGCTKMSTPEHQYYLLNFESYAPRHPQTSQQPSLTLASVTAWPPFDQLHFLYRIGDNQYRIDNYHRFLVAPNLQIESWLKTHGVNRTNNQGKEPQLSIEILAWYADYRDRNHPQATITLQFTLQQPQPMQTNTTLWHKNYHIAIPLVAKETSCLLQAWSTGLQQLLSQGLAAAQAVGRTSTQPQQTQSVEPPQAAG